VKFDPDTAVPLLSRTPAVLDGLLRDLPAEWTAQNEGPETWSPYDVVGHLIHGERTDWMPRAEHVMRHGEVIPFPPFDRFAQFTASQGKNLVELLDTFAGLRRESIRRLEALRLTPADLERTGTHPEFGRVTLGQHLATWVAHDLDHIMQIVRVMAFQYLDAVGPWRRYLRIVGPDRLRQETKP
jgi:hypothetical protein